MPSKGTVGAIPPGCGFSGCGIQPRALWDDQERFVKLLAFLTATCMLLATYALTALRRRLGGMLDAWGHDAVDRWSPAIPSPPK